MRCPLSSVIFVLIRDTNDCISFQADMLFVGYPPIVYIREDTYGDRQYAPVAGKGSDGRSPYLEYAVDIFQNDSGSGFNSLAWREGRVVEWSWNCFSMGRQALAYLVFSRSGGP